MTTIMSMDGVCLSFGSKQVLHNLTFAVRRGETFGFLGPSGAGKTTTIKLLTRQLVKDSGASRCSAVRSNARANPTTNASASSRIPAPCTSG